MIAALEVILAGLVLGAALYTLPPKWAYGTLAAFVLADLAILASNWPPVTPSAEGYSTTAIFDQADVTRAGRQLAGAIVVGGLGYAATRLLKPR